MDNRKRCLRENQVDLDLDLAHYGSHTQHLGCVTKPDLYSYFFTTLSLELFRHGARLGYIAMQVILRTDLNPIGQSTRGSLTSKLGAISCPDLYARITAKSGEQSASFEGQSSFVIRSGCGCANMLDCIHESRILSIYGQWGSGACLKMIQSTTVRPISSALHPNTATEHLAWIGVVDTENVRRCALQMNCFLSSTPYTHVHFDAIRKLTPISDRLETPLAGHTKNQSFNASKRPHFTHICLLAKPKPFANRLNPTTSSHHPLRRVFDDRNSQFLHHQHRLDSRTDP
jgi:hypothetical protein